MTKDFRTDVEFNNSLTASAGTTTLGTTNISGNITMLNTGTPALLWQTYTVASAVNTTFKYMEMLAKPIGTSNTDGLRFFINRDVGGADWQSESWNIQRYVDGTSMGYIQFGSDYPFEQNIKLGIGSTDYIYVTSTNTIISNNLTASGGTTTLGTSSIGSLTATSGITSTAGNNIFSSITMNGSTTGSTVFKSQNTAYNQVQNLPVTAGTIPTVQFSYATSSATNTSSVNWVVPTGFASATMYPNRTYEFEIILFAQMSAGVPMHHRFFAPSVTNGAVVIILTTNTTQVSMIGSNNTISTGANIIANTTTMNAAAVDAPHIIKGWIVPSASGTFYYGGFRLGTATAATASVFNNSFMRVAEIG